ncbi:MAG: DUF5110 domain-containing protein [Candidatus Coatesbacteria bacterium]
MTTRIDSSSDASAVTVTIAARNMHAGGYSPAPRDLVLEIHARAASITSDGAVLPRISAEALSAGNPGWTVAGKITRVRFSDTGASARIVARTSPPQSNPRRSASQAERRGTL